MKRTVYNTVIGLMLVCGLTMISTGAFAQGRRPATTSNNAAAAGNRSVATAPKQNAAVSNNSSRTTTTTVQRTTTTTTTTKPSTTVSGTVKNSNAGNRSANTTTSTVRSNNTSGNNGGNSGHNGGNNGGTVRPNTGGNNGTGNTGHNGGNNGGTVRPNTGGNNGTGNTGHNGGNNGNVRPNNGGNNGTGHSTAPTSRPSTGNPRPKIGGSVMNGGSPKINYNDYRYNSTWRPRYDGDRFFNHFRYNSWSWTNPIRPSVRQYRPSTIWVYRPIVTVNVNRYVGYPTIAGVLGLTWGTSFGNALNYLYYNGYYIDGYMDNIVYVTDVELMNYDWDDVMIQFDGNNRLDYVEFAYWTSGYDTSRFFSLYNELCSIYGSPVSYTNSMYSWYGGDGIGYVNLGLDYTSGNVCYTVLAFGI